MTIYTKKTYIIILYPLLTKTHSNHHFTTQSKTHSKRHFTTQFFALCTEIFVLARSFSFSNLHLHFTHATVRYDLPPKSLFLLSLFYVVTSS